MTSKFKIKTTHFQYTSSGVKETAQQNQSKLKYVLFCDAVPAPSSDASQEKSSPYTGGPIEIVEKAVLEKLGQLQPEKLTETFLSAALQYANTKLLAYNRSQKSTTLVSAVILALNPSAIDPSLKEKGAELIVAGLGDCRVYQIDDEGISLTFYDPANPYRSMYATAQKRILSMDNALGKRSNVQIQSRKIFKNSSQKYLIASCGVFQQATEQELLALGLSPKDPKTGVAAFMASCASKENGLRLASVSLENSSSLPKAPPASEPAFQPNRRKGRLYTVATVSASTLVILSLALFIIKNKMDSKQQAPALKPITKESPELLALQKQSQAQGEMIHFMKNEIDTRTKELNELREQLASVAHQPQIVAQTRSELEQASKIIDELRQMLHEKEQKAKELEQLSVQSESPLKSTSLSAQSRSALQALNNQLLQQFDTLQKAYAQQKTQASSLKKVVAEIKQSLLKKEKLLSTSQQSSEQINQEAKALREVIIHLQKSTLSQLDSAKKQIAKQISEIAEEKMKEANSYDNEEGAEEIQTQDALRPHFHIVEPGETLESISKAYYGTPDRWKEIYAANYEHITDKDHLPVGIKLFIP